jgi:methyltransferase
MTLPAAVLLLVALQRAAELALAARNTRRLRALGAIETDRHGYPWFVVLHGAWLASLWLAVLADAAASWPLLGLYGTLQLARLWSIASLGRYWTTRILTLPGAPLVATGPYRWLRHPNYLIVTAEIAVLPLAFGALALALVFSAANFVLLARRIAIEERALAPRRQGAVDMPTTTVL